MAPVVSHVDIPDLKFSSLELDARSVDPNEMPTTSFSKRSIFPERIYNPLLPRSDDPSSILSPMDTYNVLAARNAQNTKDPNPGAGSINPNDINMKGIQALFAIIGASFVLGAIWFFFWAKNGGFKWQKGDWEEYKSTVLRRKGPNGTTLSNATKSTRLGGGSVVGDGYSDKDTATIPDTMSEAMTETRTELSSEAPIIKEKQSKKRKETAKERKIREANEARWEGGHDYDVRAYRHERPARVGGLNKDSDAQFYGTDYTETERGGSDIVSNGNRQAPSSRQHSPEKRQTRRDFSYGQESFSVSTPPPAAAPSPGPRPPRYHSPNKNASPQRPIRTVPGSFHANQDIENQTVQSQYTKTYHHPLPSLSGQGPPRTGGYRRDRRNSLDD
ncbi:uncharacterized protein Z520_08430 [Fonsecaea multimorphosa CBS 102226]|uniref:Uncharacterized protein n=1 Tax=Fonsecaea multimorphosa CBS 102226 TaxID=1442371 RepID=A0A0D2KGB7_9EURO|nr:uncharacterized protein Z520_08430 [Fonsecaea multimorphosa CBS 102226]KIX95723.1 hypothetical protein Z520_08430 [Fonsecaea multimorphosa CBS 102226]OAL21462.1 hypothetical protein AYO22_07858 [Fonsecaea multimorphosa]